MSKEYLTPDLLGSVYLYADSSVANTSFCYVVSLTMAVDRELLGRAVSDLMPRFPQFSLRVISGADSCSYALMTSAVPVFPVGDRTRVSESGMFGPAAGPAGVAGQLQPGGEFSAPERAERPLFLRGHPAAERAELPEHRIVFPLFGDAVLADDLHHDAVRLDLRRV